jgi:HTH-type transcriptional regulator/antitoxin HipB
MTQRDLADRLGLSQPRIAEIERRPGRITVDQLLAVMHALGATALVTSGREVDLSGQATVSVTGEVAAPSTKKDDRSPKGEW